MWQTEQLRISASPLRELFDACAKGYLVKFVCGACGHQRIFAPHAVWHHFRSKGWPESLREVPRHFRCGTCKRRGPVMDLVREEADDHSLPLPGEEVWKKELRRRR